MRRVCYLTRPDAAYCGRQVVATRTCALHACGKLVLAASGPVAMERSSVAAMERSSVQRARAALHAKHGRRTHHRLVYLGSLLASSQSHNSLRVKCGGPQK